MTQEEQEKDKSKILTKENWLARDGRIEYFTGLGKDDDEFRTSIDKLAELILRPSLSERVPEDVKELFETARAVMCYGCFYYPLFTLGTEQIYRVQEAALYHKCVEMKAPKSAQDGFAKMLNWLEKEQVIKGPEVNQWQSAKRLRNHSSHTTRQSLYDPHMALSITTIAAKLINNLFPIYKLE